MLRRYAVLSWQNVAREAIRSSGVPAGDEVSAFSGSIVCRRLDRGARLGASDCFVEHDATNSEIAARYGRIRASTIAIEPCVFDVSGWLAAGPEGLLIDPVHGRCLIGDALGWSREYARHYTERLFSAIWEAGDAGFSADIPKPRGEITGAFASAPGQGVYGHWILDYVPRFHIMAGYGLGMEKVRSWLPKSWATTFTEACGITIDPLADDDSRRCWMLRDCSITGFLKSGYTVNRDVCREAWLAFAKIVLGSAATLPPVSARKLFVTRAGLPPGGRSLGNTAKVEAIARNRGYAVIAPEAYPVATQAKIFHDADIVVGEDGSALHNVVFCKPGLHLGVINLPDRCNLWHASICDALGHKIAYAEAEPVQCGPAELDLERFREFLAALETSRQQMKQLRAQRQ